MRKTFWVIFLSVLIFLSGTVLGVSTVYQVDYVTVEASTVSEEAALQVQELQERLGKAYEKSNIFFVDKKSAEKIIGEYSYFRMTGFKKSYPNRLIVQITEGAEVYAIEGTNNYYILDGEGSVLSIRDSYVNALNGAENVVWKGLNVSAQIGKTPTGDEAFSSMLTLCQTISKKFGGIRTNVDCVEVFLRTPETIYCVTMREGIKIYFGAPNESVEEKVEMAMDKYLSLTDEEKMKGWMLVSENQQGVFLRYSKTGDYQG